MIRLTKLPRSILSIPVCSSLVLSCNTFDPPVERNNDNASDDTPSDDIGSDGTNDDSVGDEEVSDDTIEADDSDDSAEPDTSDVSVQLVNRGVVDKLDLLFVVDNSSSMTDKHVFLQHAVSDLISRFVNPLCLSYNSPLCQTEAGYGMTQTYAKAYPAIRELQATELFAEVSPSQNAIVTSICPKETEDTTSRDFGYRPAVAAVV